MALLTGLNCIIEIYGAIAKDDNHAKLVRFKEKNYFWGLKKPSLEDFAIV
jgi:hypothetical protein